MTRPDSLSRWSPPFSLSLSFSLTLTTESTCKYIEGGLPSHLDQEKKRRVSRGGVRRTRRQRCNAGGTASACVGPGRSIGSAAFFAAFLVGLWCKINGAFFSLPPLGVGRAHDRHGATCCSPLTSGFTLVCRCSYRPSMYPNMLFTLLDFPPPE